jgi:hypothetical protein
MGERRGSYKVSVRKPEESRQPANPGADGRILLKWIFKTWNKARDSIDLVEDRRKSGGGGGARVKAVKSLRIP